MWLYILYLEMWYVGLVDLNFVLFIIFWLIEKIEKASRFQVTSSSLAF